MQRTIRLLVAAGLVLMVSCDVASPARTDTRPGPATREHDYDEWFTNGTRLASAPAAVNAVDLPIVVPTDLGETRCVCLGPGGRAVAFIYDSPKLGRVVIVEGPLDYVDPDMQRQAYENTVAQNGKPNVHGTAEMVMVKGGVMGLLTTSEDGTRSGLEIVLWAEKGDVQFYVTGPALTREQALEIANEHL